MEILVGCIFGVIIFIILYSDFFVRRKILKVLYYIFLIVLILIGFYFIDMDFGPDFFAFVTGIIALFVERYFTNRKNKKTFSDRDKLISGKLYDMGNSLVEIKEDLNSLKGDIDFRNILRNQIRVKTSQIVDFNIDIELEYKNIMMAFGEMAEELALKFYYSEHRNDSLEMKKYLESLIKFEKAKIKNLIDTYILELKVYGKPKKRIKFSDFIEERDVDAYRKLEMLKLELVKNGLRQEDVIKKFTIFLEYLLKDFMSVIVVWKRLNYE